jgi:hypothetical protein
MFLDQPEANAAFRAIGLPRIFHEAEACFATSISEPIASAQLVHRIVRAQKKIAKSQEVLANKQQLDMQDKLDEPLEKMSHMPDPHR